MIQPPLAPRFSPVLLLLCIGWLSGISLTAQAIDRAADNTAGTPLPTAEAEAQFHVLAGELAAGRKMPELAAREFLLALNVFADPQLASRATGLALSSQNDELALTVAKRWLELEPTSLDAREVITLLSLRKGLLGDVYDQCAAVVRDHPGGEADGFRHVALLLSSESKQKDAVLAVLKQLVGQWPELAGAHYALGLAAMRFNDLAIADRAAHEALRLEPGSVDARMLIAGVLVKKGELDAADQMIESLVPDAPLINDLRMGYARLLMEAQQRDRARRQLLLIVANDPTDSDARYALGLMALEDRKLDEATANFRVLADKGDRQNEAAYYLGRIEETQNRLEKALAWYQRVGGGNQAIDAAVRSAQVLARLKRIDQARAELRDLRRQFPQLASRFDAIEGELLLGAGEPTKALAVLNTALINQPQDADLLFGRSLVHEKLGHIDLAEADLRQLLALNKDDARALNALGYLLTLNTTRLEEARELLSQALALVPEDGAVIDSMGWLQFRLGNLQEALSLLQKAYELAPDPEIAAHLGEVLWALGEKERARSVWHTAQQEAPDHEVLRETVNRLNR